MLSLLLLCPTPPNSSISKKSRNMARTHQTPSRKAGAAATKRERYGKKPIRFRPGTVALRMIR